MSAGRGRAAHKQWPILGPDERAATLRVLDRGVLSGASAPETILFEREFAAFVDAEFALLTSSGTSALQLALAAAGIGAGDHVITPAYSFVATPLAILQCGAIPIFVDVDAGTGLMNFEATKAAMTSRTRAIMPVHIHGCAIDIERFATLGVPVIEDAAQAHGATLRGKKVGAIGKVGGFSLQSSKNLGVGEGGVLVTNDRSIVEAANRLRSFGQNVILDDFFDPARPLDGTRALASSRIGSMLRGNELTAAIARAQLAKLEERTEASQRRALALSMELARLPGVLPPQIPKGSTSVFHKFRVGFDPTTSGVTVPPKKFRDVMIAALRKEGLEVVQWQSEALPAHPVFRERQGFGGGFPWNTDPDTDFASIYDLARFPNTTHLLDSSIVLFSQSCPLIAQDDDIVAFYAETFARVWERRFELLEG
jgi:dTDP-4-amino-4,6-dideoxygalactose transaminase